MLHRLGAVLFAGPVLLLAGCARMGLDPMPEDQAPGGMDHGLDPFPEAMHPDGSAAIGLDPFPPAASKPADGEGIGLDPFPPAVHPGGKTSTGLDPFPKMARGKGFPGLGLDPFPVHKGRREKAAAAKVTASSTKTVSTETPASDEYPGQPPVVLPESPERNEDVGTEKPAKKRRDFRDD